MALKGTLKDFGIADILNLIGQQRKTGVLFVRSRTEEVEVSFRDGSVVRAMAQSRKSRELLGSMLVRAELVSPEQLEKALEVQGRTLKRLGDILVAEGALKAENLREMTELQTAETLYRLFEWKSGTYEFAQQDVEHDRARGTALRPEAVLMEGFRRIDEWPLVRKVVTDDAMTFERLKRLGPPPVRPDSDGAELDAAFDAAMEGGSRPEEPVPRNIGRAERTIYRLAEPSMTVRRICDVSRMGDFVAQKALCNLVQAAYLGPAAPVRKSDTGRSGATPVLGDEVRQVLRRGVTQAGVGLLLVALFALAARALGSSPLPGGTGLAAGTVQARGAIVDVQRIRLQTALELFRLEKGRYPERLAELAEAGIVGASELHRPFDREYHYRQDGAGYVLLPPLP